MLPPKFTSVAEWGIFMGKLILCAGRTAGEPYCFKLTDTPVYTIEELCYYIYHNLESVSEELFNQELIDFIREELGLKERADFLEELLKKKAGIKDLVVSILCSCDLYDKTEINQLIAEIDILFRLTPIQRKKRQADFCLSHHKFKEAMKEYLAILNNKEFTDLTGEEYGDILHNMGVLEARTGAFTVAADKFREAYERNHNEKSLKQYLYALKCSKQEALFEREVKILVGNRELLKQIEEELYHAWDASEYTGLYAEVVRLSELKENGKYTEFYDRLNELVKQLKIEYRKDSI